MRNSFTTLGGPLIVLIGALLLAYPSVSNWQAQHNAVAAKDAYVEDTYAMTPEEVNEELDKAKEYNNALSGEGIEDPFVPVSGIIIPENYTSILNFGDGVMGYIQIPDIDVLLPIYHGTSEKVLKKGVGHMDNTTFPIGGKGNHSVLTGHTGLASAKLFTDLIQLEIGDVFHIIIMLETYSYKVDQILVVEPSDTEVLTPVNEEDYVTLVTCTPYGINSHRLLVRGIRIPNEEYDQRDNDINTKAKIDWKSAIIVAVAILLMIFATFVIVNLRKKQK